MKGKVNKLVKGSFFLGAGAFISKLIGALYRVPLTALIGSYGLGLYQLVFPVYTVLLDFSGAGVPSAMSKLIASENHREKYKYLRVSLRVFSILGLICTVIMAILSSFLSKAQGDSNAFYAYLSLSPAIFFVCAISCFRGYFQGQMNMVPTAVSQITEQIVKLILGLTLCYKLLPNIPLAVAGATFAITVSEIIALIGLFITFRIKNKGVKLKVLSRDNDKFFSGAKRLIKLTIPITLTGIILPLSQVIDSFITVNILKTYTAEATTLYGLFSGVCMTVVHLPVAICYGISASVIPAVSSVKTVDERRDSIKKSLFLTFILSFLMAVGVFVFSKFILKILFRSLSETELIISSNLLKISTFTIVFHSLLQTINGILIGVNKTYYPLIGMGLGLIIKIILSIFLISNSQINVYGSAIALNACYFIAFLVNFILVVKKDRVNASKRTFVKRQAS